MLTTTEKEFFLTLLNDASPVLYFRSSLRHTPENFSHIQDPLCAKHNGSS